MMLHQLNEQLYTATKTNSYKTLGILLKNAFGKEKSQKIVLISPMIASYHAKSMYVAENWNAVWKIEIWFAEVVSLILIFFSSFLHLQYLGNDI